MSEAKDLEQKFFIKLISGQVYFHPEGEEGDVQSVHMNAVSLLVEDLMGSKELADAQATMQRQLRARTGDKPIVIVDVVFNSISSLGYMTSARWMNTNPEALKESMDEVMKVLGKGVKEGE